MIDLKICYYSIDIYIYINIDFLTLYIYISFTSVYALSHFVYQISA